jgi:hypothetical protein
MRPLIRILLLSVFIYQAALGQNTISNGESYRLLKGTIDKYPVTMYLYGFKGQWTGNYAYDRVGQPLNLFGIDTLKDGTVKVDVFKGGVSEAFDLRPTTDGLEGVWRKDAKSAALPVSLKEVKPTVPMRMVHQSARVAHRPANPESPGCGFEATTVWPQGNSPAEEFVKRQIRSSLDEKATGSPTPETLISNMSRKYIDACKEDAKNAKEEELKEMPSMYSRDIVHRVTVNHQSAEFLCLEDMEWEYSGGAHGNGFSLYRILDLKNQKRLGMNDIFTPTGVKALPKLIENRFRSQYGLKPGQSLRDAGLFENRISKATQNVYLTPKGVVFSYTTYEIGPYAMGPIEVFVPYSELKPHLQPAFAKRTGV